VIPSLQAIDSAYQEARHLPVLIDQANQEHLQLSQQFEHNLSEIDAMKAEKEALAVEIAVLREKLRVAREEANIFSDATVRVKRDFDLFLEKTRVGVAK
jgi:hypothetical protein